MYLDLDKVNLPRKIDPCPIIEAIVEFRFDSSVPHDAILGIIYKEFKGEYPNVEELPILQLPELVRRQDKSLCYKPYYNLTNDDNFIFKVGARVFSLICKEPYVGWEQFSGRLKDILARIRCLEILNSYIRIGIRYINGFDCNIFEKTNLSLKMSDQSLADFGTSMRLEIPTGNFISTLRIANKAKVTKANGNSEGSIIDIDTFLEGAVEDEMKLIETGHLEEKKLFFSLLKEEFIVKELNPEY